MKRKLIIAAILLVVVSVTVIYVVNFTGRSISRLTGGLVSHKVELPNCAQFIGVVFEKKSGSTVKVVTYRGFDGSYYTEEFKDFSPLEARIKWVAPEGSERVSWIQKRTLSRWTGSEVKVLLPKDFYSFAGPVSTPEKGSGHAKNVTYWTKNGELKTQEYVDWSPFEGVILWQLPKEASTLNKSKSPKGIEAKSEELTTIPEPL